MLSKDDSILFRLATIARRKKPNPDMGLFDFHEKDGWLKRRTKSKWVQDIPYRLVSSIHGITPDEYLIDLYRKGLLTGKAKEYVENIIG